MNFTFKLSAVAVIASLTALSACAKEEEKVKKPNILIAISDDHSFAHTSAAGSPFVNTPNVERIASEGFRFNNAYAGSPGCSPSRAVLLTGRHHWMIGPAGTHGSSFPEYEITFTDLLEEDGYKVGFTGKGWGPGNWAMGGRTQNPAGVEYNEKLLGERPKGIGNKDYAANFAEFMKDRKDGEPFAFWYGSNEPHLGYEEGPYTEEEQKDVIVPDFLPDTEASRTMMLDYAAEIEHYDNHLGKILAMLEEAGELDNTIIIATADNGMPHPRAKATGFDYGIHVPLAIRWPEGGQSGKVIDGLVGFTDITATILDVVGLEAPAENVGQSIKSLLTGDVEELDYERAVFSGRERHSSARYNNYGYPQRMMRRGDFLVIWNAKSDRFPAGAPQKIVDGEMVDGFHDIDDSESKRELMAMRDDPYIGPFFHLATDKQPEWQLYNSKTDPYSLTNLAEDEDHAEIFNSMKDQLMETLKSTGDLRVLGHGDVWEGYPRIQGDIRRFPKPE